MAATKASSFSRRNPVTSKDSPRRNRPTSRQVVDLPEPCGPSHAGIARVCRKEGKNWWNNHTKKKARCSSTVSGTEQKLIWSRSQGRFSFVLNSGFQGEASDSVRKSTPSSPFFPSLHMPDGSLLQTPPPPSEIVSSF